MIMSPLLNILIVETTSFGIVHLRRSDSALWESNFLLLFFFSLGNALGREVFFSIHCHFFLSCQLIQILLSDRFGHCTQQFSDCHNDVCTVENDQISGGVILGYLSRKDHSFVHKMAQPMQTYF